MPIAEQFQTDQVSIETLTVFKATFVTPDLTQSLGQMTVEIPVTPDVTQTLGANLQGSVS